MRNLKKVVALVAVFAMMISTVAFAQSFTDVSEEHDAYEAIEMLSNLGILTGDDQDGDGKMDFRPEDPITRAEVAAVMSRIQGINSVGQASTQFTDVAQSHWASGYVAQAAGQGIVNGYGDGNFGPEDNILVEQAIKMVMVTIGYEPFAADNGGYPTGYQTAAQRYGVLKDVTGAAAGVEATRATVAQLVYNAIDTPLMDRWTYGADAEYVIYNGKGDYDFMTLLTRDLGVKKFTGVVSENLVTTLADKVTVDTEDEEEIDVDIDASLFDAWGNSDYDLDEIVTIYANGTDAAEYIAQHVEVYVEEAAKKGEYNIISIAPTNKNKATTIALDAYQGYDETDSVIEYLKNDTDSRNTTIKVESDAVVFLNGVYFGTVAGLDTSVLKNEVLVNSAYSGEVVLLDNGVDTYANYVFFNIATAGVIDEVSASGKVTFKNDPETLGGNAIKLQFDEEDYTQIIDITKNGEAVDYTELEEWDVLSILANDKNEYYVVSVIDEGKIDGTITQRAASDTSATSLEYTINGTPYDVAIGAYECGTNLKPGAAGTFYIDNFGKIVAYDKSGAAVASDNYGYVLNTAKTEDDWENENLKVQILAKDGNVYEAFLAEKVKLEFATNVAITKDATDVTLEESATYDIEDLDMDVLAAELKNELITYAANSTGEFKTITFAQGDEDETSLHLTDAAASVEFDGEDFVIDFGKKYDVAEDAIVFFIQNSTNDVYVSGSKATGDASKTMSKVTTAAALSDGETYAYGQLFDSQDDVANVIVLYNTTGGISSASNIAVIDKVGEAAYNGEEALAVTYYMGGVLYTSYTDPDYNPASGHSLEGAQQGDIYKLAVSADGTIITESLKYYDYARTDAADEAGAMASVNWESGKQKMESGVVVDYVSGRKTIRVAADVLLDNNSNDDPEDDVYGPDYKDYYAIKLAEGANVYVLDPNKAKNKLTIGAASDVDVDKEVLEHAQKVVAGTASALVFEDATVAADEVALGAMDYVVAFSYDDDVVDVVIYKAYDFGKIQ